MKMNVYGKRLKCIQYIDFLISTLIDLLGMSNPNEFICWQRSASHINNIITKYSGNIQKELLKQNLDFQVKIYGYEDRIASCGMIAD